MNKYFELIIFTASESQYAEAVVNILDPGRKMISYILDRRHCSLSKYGFWIKDLRIIGNREMKNLIIIDNFVYSFGLNLDNGIPILEYTGDPNDRELVNLQEYLIKVSKCDDIPSFNRKNFKLRDFYQFKMAAIIFSQKRIS